MAWNDVDTSRAVIFPGFFERQKASYDADTGQLFGEVTYPTQVGGMAIEPFAGLALVSIDGDSFRERGAALASLRGSSTDQDVGYSTLGCAPRPPCSSAACKSCRTSRPRGSTPSTT